MTQFTSIFLVDMVTLPQLQHTLPLLEHHCPAHCSNFTIRLPLVTPSEQHHTDAASTLDTYR